MNDVVTKPIIGNNALQKLKDFLADNQYSQLFLLCDENTFRHCYSIVKPLLPQHHLYKIPAGENFKNLATCENVWQWLTDHEADRDALMLNLGGGVVGDLGGFSAATYKRGIRFVQVPTTLLAQIDASVGGKTGIDFNGFKNHIGVFAQPEAVYIYPDFLKTLPPRELFSGYAEMLKHYLLADRASWKEVKSHSPQELDLEKLLPRAVDIKSKIVFDDPIEKGSRKLLNLGHTIGHAVESAFLNENGKVIHGEAVAMGILCEAYIGHRRQMLPSEDFLQITDTFTRIYSKIEGTELAVEQIIKNCRQDKKNSEGKISCVLLERIGKADHRQFISEAEIRSALLWYSQMG